jgi:hypothetical protein
MPAEDPLDVGVTPNNLCETGAPGEPCLVHPADTGRKRRMVREYQSGTIPRAREDAIEPAQPLRAQSPAALARH